MFLRPFIKAKEEISIEAGSVLVAQPFWDDDKYKRSVILLLEHDSVRSTGIILNKQSTLCLYDALPEIQTGLPLYFGGPFYQEQISFIHGDPWFPEAVHLGSELFLNGNYSYLKKIIVERKLNMRKIKFFAGMVEWSSGELETEVKENKWWVNKITAQEFFTADSDELWSYELLSNGHLYGLLNEFPDPCLN